MKTMDHKTKPKRAFPFTRGKKPNSLYFLCVSVLVACEFLLSFSYFGYINITPISVTTLHVVVLFAALFFGKGAGALVGLAFGLSSMWKASVLPFVTANAAFCPMISPDPFGSVVTSIGTRVIFGFLAGVIYEYLAKHLSEWPAVILGTFIATLIHSLLVYTSMWIFFPDFGITPLNAFYSLVKVNALITYGIAFAVICGMEGFLRHSRRGIRLTEVLQQSGNEPFDANKEKYYFILLLLSLIISISLASYFIDDITRVFTYYKVTLAPETQALVTNMGLQFVCGTLAAFIIFTTIFIRIYKIMGEEREKAQASKIKFFANVSHDMRTPLNAILGFANLAESPDVSEEERLQYLNKIENSGELLLDLINDTLTISKASNGKIVLHPEPCEIKALRNAIIPQIEELSRKKSIALVLDESGYQNRTVLMDKLNVEKILLNLLTNAVKYTPAGGHVWLTIRDEPAGQKDADLVFVIRDDGIGMSEEFIRHAYEPFAQENQVGYESYGTGLGLAIVKQLVDLMGGHIDIHSELKKGTEFIVQLHFAETEPISAGSLEKLDPDYNALAGKKILLCEDNTLNQEIAAAMLRKYGVVVATAENGEECLKMYQGSAPHEYDAILMDLRMPIMNGFEATRAIRNMEREDAQEIPIVAMTADVFEESIRTAEEAGMNEYITKPINAEELFSVLRKVTTENTGSAS